jgi:hypothetical protein
MGDIHKYRNYDLNKPYKNNANFGEKNNYCKYTLRDSKLISYSYIEDISPFLNDFKRLYKNKKILIISPFSETIKHQFKSKDKLLKNFEYPDFELLTYTTPVTYNNNTPIVDEVKTDNWFEQCEVMCNEIKDIEFDCAFLACATYSLLIGDFIKNKMKKKALYVGGCLNVFFNIKSGRYNNIEYYRNMFNMEHNIEALEKSKYENSNAERTLHCEGLLAYGL